MKLYEIIRKLSIAQKCLSLCLGPAEATEMHEWEKQLESQCWNCVCYALGRLCSCREKGRFRENEVLYGMKRVDERARV